MSRAIEIHVGVPAAHGATEWHRFEIPLPGARQVACDRCSQGVMDATNDHAHGRCRCDCHDKSESLYCPEFGCGWVSENYSPFDDEARTRASATRDEHTFKAHIEARR